MSDIEGSTRLFHRFGSDYVPLLAEHRRLLRDAVARHRGHEVETEGDALLLAFADAADGIAAALDGQRALAAHQWPAGGDVRVRIGLHTGAATPVGGGYVALAVHQTARISAGAHGGQVLMSDATATAAAGRLPPGASVTPLGSFQLRGFPTPERLFQLVHPDLPGELPAAPRARRGRAQPAVPAGRLRRPGGRARGARRPAAGHRRADRRRPRRSGQDAARRPAGVRRDGRLRRRRLDGRAGPAHRPRARRRSRRGRRRRRRAAGPEHRGPARRGARAPVDAAAPGQLRAPAGRRRRARRAAVPALPAPRRPGHQPGTARHRRRGGLAALAAAHDRPDRPADRRSGRRPSRPPQLFAERAALDPARLPAHRRDGARGGPPGRPPRRHAAGDRARGGRPE